MNENILEKLKDNGEQNCSLIFHRFDVDGEPENNDINFSISNQYNEYTPPPPPMTNVSSPDNFNYHVDKRWYSHVAKFIPAVVPMVAPIISKSIFGDSGGSGGSGMSDSGFFDSNSE